MLNVPSLAATEKQERLMFEWATERRYDVTSIASLPEAALALAEAHLVEVILVVTHTAATFEMRGHAVLAGVRVEELREGAYMRRLSLEQKRDEERERDVQARLDQQIEQRLARHEEELLARLLRQDLKSPMTRTIIDAALRGVPPEQIAGVFDVPVATVYAAIGKHLPDEPGPADSGKPASAQQRRARQLTHPQGRR